MVRSAHVGARLPGIISTYQLCELRPFTPPPHTCVHISKTSIVRVSISCRVLRTCKRQSPKNIQQVLAITIINSHTQWCIEHPHMHPLMDLCLSFLGESTPPKREGWLGHRA